MYFISVQTRLMFRHFRWYCCISNVFVSSIHTWQSHSCRKLLLKYTFVTYAFMGADIYEL